MKHEACCMPSWVETPVGWSWSSVTVTGISPFKCPAVLAVFRFPLSVAHQSYALQELSVAPQEGRNQSYRPRLGAGKAVR